METEFGEDGYRLMMNVLVLDSKETIFSYGLVRVIMECMEKKRFSELEHMKGRLEKTLLRSYEVSRGFWPYLFFCLGAMVVLWVFGAWTWMTVTAAGGIFLCLLFRVTEYLVNRNCYLDARMVLCYRVALERLINERKC